MYLKLSILGEMLSRQHTAIFFLFFLTKEVLTFHANCSPMQTICMKCQSLFTWKNKKNIIFLSAAELAKRVITVYYQIFLPSYGICLCIIESLSTSGDNAQTEDRKMDQFFFS